MGGAMAQGVRFRYQNENVRIRLDVSLSGNYSEQGGTEAGFSSTTSVRFSPRLRRTAANSSQ